MDNEMKEPNDEQMRSASDEQKPNNEGKHLLMALTTLLLLKIDHQMKMASFAKKKRTTHL